VDQVRRVEVQIFDGDGIEPADVKKARLEREANRAVEEFKRKREAEAERYATKQKRRALDYKQSLKDHPLTVGAIKFQIERLREDVIRLIILTEMPPPTFNHILEINRPKLTVRSPMESYHHTVAEIEYPMVWIFHNPKVRTYKYEELHIDGVTGRQKRDSYTRIYQHTLTLTCSKAQDHSATTYKNLKALIQHAQVPA
jgi:hypothetical protein